MSLTPMWQHEQLKAVQRDQSVKVLELTVEQAASLKWAVETELLFLEHVVAGSSARLAEMQTVGERDEECERAKAGKARQQDLRWIAGKLAALLG